MSLTTLYTGEFLRMYHISKDGNPGKCTARIRCPFGGIHNHFHSPVDARLAFEDAQEVIQKGKSQVLETLEEARQIISLLKHEGHRAVVEKINDSFIVKLL